MRRNVASQTVAAQLVDKADGSAVTSGTTTVYVTKDAGTQSTGAGTVAHEGNGQWSYTATQSESDATHVAITFANTSAVSACVNVYPVVKSSTGTIAADLAAIARAVHGYSNVYCVLKSGNDASDGLTPATAKLTATAANALASAGDLILIGPGAFNEAKPFQFKAAVTYRGAGTSLTTLQTSNGDNDASMKPASRMLVEDMTLEETNDGFLCYIAGSTEVLDALYRNVRFISNNLENIDIQSTTPCSLRFEECYLQSVSEWPFTIVGAAHRVECVNVTTLVTANGSTGDCKGVYVDDGARFIGHNCRFLTTEAASGGQAIRIVGASSALLTNCSFFPGEVHVEDVTGYLVLIDSEFDRSQVTGQAGRVIDIRSVKSVTSAVTVGTNNDKTGYGLADGAISAAKIASDTITAVKIADNAITASKIASDAFTTAKFADGALTAAKFAANFLNAAKIDADALLAIANKVEAEIIDETDSDKVLTAITNKIAAVNPTLGDLSIATIAAGVWQYLAASATTPNSIGKRISDNLDTNVGSRGTSTYAGGDTAGTTTLLARATEARLARLDIGANTLAHTGNATSFMADVSGLFTAAAGTALSNAVATRAAPGDEMTLTEPTLEQIGEAAGGDGAEVDLDELAARVAALIVGQEVAFPGPFLADGTLVLVAGDDYTGDRALTFSKSYAGDTPSSLQLRVIRQDLYATTGDATAGTVLATATPTGDGTTLSVSFEPTYTATAALGPARDQSGNVLYRFRVVDPTARVTHWAGKTTVMRAVSGT